MTVTYGIYSYDLGTGKVYGRGGKELTARTKDGYLKVVYNGRTWLLHRFIFIKLMGIDIPDGMQVDHIDRDRTNNAWYNLRLVTPLENNRNLSMRSDNSSGYTGVSYDRSRGMWYASIRVEGANITLGRYRDRVDALAARTAAEAEYGFSPTHGQKAGS